MGQYEEYGRERNSRRDETAVIIKPCLCVTVLYVFTVPVAGQEPRVSESIRGLTSEDSETISKSVAYLKEHYTEARPAMLAALDNSDELSLQVSQVFEAVGERAIPDLVAAFQNAGKLKKCNLAQTLG